MYAFTMELVSGWGYIQYLRADALMRRILEP